MAEPRAKRKSGGKISAGTGAWVYVNSGQVCIGTGNGGNTSCNAYSTTTGQWE